MSSSFSANHIGLAFIGGAVITSSIVAFCFSNPIKHRIVSNEKELPNPSATVPSHIREELFSRIKSFFGEQSFATLENSFVIVVGLGGVGSHAANMLVRSGIGKIRLIDFDQVTLSSLNRHASATLDDVGISKVEAMKRSLLKTCPWCDISVYAEMFKGEVASQLLAGNPDYVIDCIDDVSTKAELIAYCLKNDIKVLTSMGAGGKSDPTKLRIAPLTECINDPLASKIKRKLKKHDVSPDKVISIFSVEKPVVELLPLHDDQRVAPQDYGTVDYVRLRVMPVLGTSPSIFGQAMASYILCNLAGRPYNPEGCERLSKNLKHKILQVLRQNEKNRFGSDAEVDLDDDDIEFIVQNVWHSRCAASERRFGGQATLSLTRWDPNLPPTPYNLVLLRQDVIEELRLRDTAKEADLNIVCKISEEEKSQEATISCGTISNSENKNISINNMNTIKVDSPNSDSSVRIDANTNKVKKELNKVVNKTRAKEFLADAIVVDRIEKRLAWAKSVCSGYYDNSDSVFDGKNPSNRDVQSLTNTGLMSSVALRDKSVSSMTGSSYSDKSSISIFASSILSYSAGFLAATLLVSFSTKRQQ